MYRTLPFACLAVVLGACAKSPTVPASSTAEAPASAPAQAATQDDGVIEVVSVPTAADSTTVAPPQPDNTRICRRERRTGTNRLVRVCRTQAEINQREIQSKETFEILRRSQQEYNQ